MNTLGIIVGVAIGVLGSLIAWLITLSILRPKIAISKDVSCIPWAEAASPYDSSLVRYRIKVENRSFRSAVDVRVNVRLAIAQEAKNTWTLIEFPEVEGSWIPRLGARSFRTRRNRIITIRLRRPRGLVELLPRQIQEQFDANLVVLEDLLSLGEKPETELRVYIMCVDGLSGRPRVFLQRYRLENVAYARFRAGSVEINPATAWLDSMRPAVPSATVIDDRVI